MSYLSPCLCASVIFFLFFCFLSLSLSLCACFSRNLLSSLCLRRPAPPLSLNPSFLPFQSVIAFFSPPREAPYGASSGFSVSRVSKMSATISAYAYLSPWTKCPPSLFLWFFPGYPLNPSFTSPRFGLHPTRTLTPASTSPPLTSHYIFFSSAAVTCTILFFWGPM